MIDTHVHLNFPELLPNLEAVLERAADAGVNAFVVPSVSAESSVSSVELSAKYATIFAAIGVHPTDVDQHTPEDQEKLIGLLQSEKKIVAIGEVGLDYYHLEGLETAAKVEAYKDRQKNLFKEMIAMAVSHKLPLIIHSREAFADTKTILAGSLHPAVIHCFTGTWEEAKAWLDLGCLLSFTGIITYKKNEALREVVAKVPLDRLMLETDAPYLAPEGFRGTTGEPKFVRQVAECIADVKGLTLEEIDRITTQTSQQFFTL